MECAMKTNIWKIDRCHFWWLCPSQTDLSCSLQRIWGPVEEKLCDLGWWTTFQVDWTQWYCGLRNPAPPWVVGTLSTIVYIYHISSGAGFRNQTCDLLTWWRSLGDPQSSPMVVSIQTWTNQLLDDLGIPPAIRKPPYENGISIEVWRWCIRPIPNWLVILNAIYF